MPKDTENQVEQHTETERSNRLAPADRVRSEATPDAGRSEHARANGLEQWNKQGHRYLDVEAAVVKFREDMNAQLGPDVTPAQTALASSATALYTGVLLTQRKLLAARGRANRIGDLLTLLPGLVGSLQRTLRLLGAQDGQADPDAPPVDATPEERREWSKRYVQRVLTEDRSAT